MKIKTTTVGADDKPRGYTMWLSSVDTYEWSNKPGAEWPCSETEGQSLIINVDSNGLCDLIVNRGRAPADISGDELNAIVADHLPARYRHLWPTWELSQVIKRAMKRGEK